MKTALAIAFAVSLAIYTAIAAPATGTVYRVVEIDSTGTLVNYGTNMPVHAASWKTNEVIVPGGTTNIIIYLGR